MSEPEEQYTLGADEPSDELVVPEAAAPKPERTPLHREEQAPVREATPRAQTRRPRATVDEADPEVDVDTDDLDSEDLDTDDVDASDDASRGATARRKTARRKTARDNERGKLRALMIFLLAVLASYGMLTRALLASPQLCDRLLSRVPLIVSLGDERLLTRKVALSDVTGSYQRIKDGKQVFTITGKALNTAPMALHGVQIAGKLLNSDGHELDQKIIFCGNVISTKVLKDLTPREVSILQTLSPKRFAIEPGESSTFVIVFMDPPREAVEFSTQVAAAQRQA